MRYTAYIHEQEGCFGVSFPDFPGCVTVGETETTALDNAIDALGGHVAALEETGQAIPKPGDYKNSLSKADIEEWQAGATLATIPLIIDRGTSVRLNISLDPGLVEAIDKEAKRRKLTRSSFLASAARALMAG